MSEQRQPWKKGEILELLDCNDTAVCRALVRLYERQTETEKAAGATKERNGRGFNGRDAAILTSLAKFYDRNGYLSKRQIDLVRKKIVKYVGQLVEIANEKIVTVDLEKLRLDRTLNPQIKESEANMRKALEIVKNMDPPILLIDNEEYRDVAKQWAEDRATEERVASAMVDFIKKPTIGFAGAGKMNVANPGPNFTKLEVPIVRRRSGRKIEV